MLPPRVDIGFTGSRFGMTAKQKEKVYALLAKWFNGGARFHHGDCVGADEEAAHVAAGLGYRIICHPPLVDELRAHFPYFECREPLSYFARNRAIVDAVNKLIATPRIMERMVGGTWYTYNYAKKKGVERYLIPPE